MNEYLEVFKGYVDMIQRHKEESSKMAEMLGCSSLDEDEYLEIFYKISDYGSTLYRELEKARRFYEEIKPEEE